MAEWILHRKDGIPVPVEVSARILDDGRWLGFVRDITERKSLHTALMETKRKYNALVETSADGFWVTGSKGDFIEVNDAYLNRSGYSREEFLNLHISDIEAAETNADTEAHIEKIIREGHDRFETWHRTKSGEIWPVEIVCTFYPFNGGTFMVFAVDISERKRAEQEIAIQQQQLAKLSQALHQAGEGIMITLPDSTIEFVNHSFSKITGYALEDAVGQKTSILKSEAQDVAI